MRASLPLVPRLKSTTGNNPVHRRLAAMQNRTARLIIDHIHKLILANPRTAQTYAYKDIAEQLGLEARNVGLALAHGGISASLLK